MKVYLKFKKLCYAQLTAEFLYCLHPMVLKEVLEDKRYMGDIFGFNDLNNLTFEQRQKLVPVDTTDAPISERIEAHKIETVASISSTGEETIRKKAEGLKSIIEEIRLEAEKKDPELKRIRENRTKLVTDEYINFDICIDIENQQYGKMLEEFFSGLTEGCLEQSVYLKRESDRMACLIGRYTNIFSQEEGDILRANGFAIRNDKWTEEENRLFRLIGRIVKPGDKLTESEANMLRANGYIIENNEIIKFN